MEWLRTIIHLLEALIETIICFFERFRTRSLTLPGLPFFHMEILMVRSNSCEVLIETTGARCELTRRSLTLIRRIDPRTNMVNTRTVGRLDFGENIGRLRVISADKRTCLVQSTRITLQFNSDSLFFISSNEAVPFHYEHINLIADAPGNWNKSGLPRDDIMHPETSRYLSRMWTDGYGGSLHAYAEGPLCVAARTENSTHFVMTLAGKMAHMVFPPRFFDFESLYGVDAKPHVWLVADSEQLMRALASADNLRSEHGFGYVLLLPTLYTGLIVERDPATLAPPCPRPVPPSATTKTVYHLPVSIVHPSARVGYEFSDPAFIRSSVAELNEKGFKVLAYMYPGYADTVNRVECSFANQQPMEATLAWMAEFQRVYGLDGYYFDYAGYGGFGGAVGPWRDNWNTTYEFIRCVREQIGDAGYIYHHNSIDVWGAYEGLRAIMIDTYCNAQLAGETTVLPSSDRPLPIDNANVHNPDERYLRFFSSGYGLSQTIGSHLRRGIRIEEEGGEPHRDWLVALSREESARVMAENLNCMERGPAARNVAIYSTAYEQMKETYSTATFTPDVQWPPDWFTRVDIMVTRSGTSVQFTWTTAPVPTDGMVTYANNGVWEPPGGQVSDSVVGRAILSQ